MTGNSPQTNGTHSPLGHLLPLRRHPSHVLFRLVGSRLLFRFCHLDWLLDHCHLVGTRVPRLHHLRRFPPRDIAKLRLNVLTRRPSSSSKYTSSFSGQSRRLLLFFRSHSFSFAFI
ncbi:Protein CBG09330 [Caenorhabditis briggsae]|uniref:Protein CBG09330 n=1 Tax=Caenorhabditis briggsae TaxID=6238 RepID=A8X9C7_CAEBR|nr:Protein CBG09330 [Caenorhabditis briggsae]CAP29239.2 Protein CBG09330 [Caenorhabditis briggsae]